MKALPKFILEKFKPYFIFNYAERRGIMVLVMLIMLAEGVNAFLPMLSEEKPFDAGAFEKEVRQFELAIWAPDTNEHENKKQEAKKKTYVTPTKTYKKKVRPVRPPLMIEINAADSAQLTKLYGIGPSYAMRILKYRRLLGGFFSKEQLLEVFGMDSIRYAGIKDHITIDSSAIKKISVNEAEFKTLLKHPYLDYETVKLICNYRKYTAAITCRDTLRSVIAFDPMYEKVWPYIKY